MPYQVEAGSLPVVVATDREAIEMFDRLVEDGGQKAIVRDMRASNWTSTASEPSSRVGTMAGCGPRELALPKRHERALQS
jgi:hypothetical protein